MEEAAVVVGEEPPKAELSPEGGDARREGELQQSLNGEGARARRLQQGKKKPQDAPAAPPKGRPKSGRVWKDPNKKRFSHMIQVKPLRSTWECKLRERQAKKLVREFAQHLKDEKQRAKEEKKQRREFNIKRRLENERKAEIVQVIRNPLKLKRAKKKQLRRIEKRDTLALLQKQQAQRKAPKE